MILMDSQTIEPLLNAFNKLEAMQYSHDIKNSHVGVINSFEECFDLMLDVLKILLAEKQHTPLTSTDILTLASLEGFISDLQVWLSFLKKRLITKNIDAITLQERDELISTKELFTIEIHQFLNKVWVSC